MLDVIIEKPNLIKRTYTNLYRFFFALSNNAPEKSHCLSNFIIEFP